MKNIEEQLDSILSLLAENEVFEWKEVKNGFDSRKLGKYFTNRNNGYLYKIKYIYEKK